MESSMVDQGVYELAIVEVKKLHYRLDIWHSYHARAKFIKELKIESR